MKNIWFLLCMPMIAFCQDKGSGNINVKDEITKKVYSVEYEHTIAEVTVERQNDIVYVGISVFYHQDHETYKALIQNKKLLKLDYDEKKNDKLIDSHSFTFETFQPELFTETDQLENTDKLYLIDTFFSILEAFQTEYENDFNRIFDF